MCVLLAGVTLCPLLAIMWPGTPCTPYRHHMHLHQPEHHFQYCVRAWRNTWAVNLRTHPGPTQQASGCNVGAMLVQTANTWGRRRRGTYPVVERGHEMGDGVAHDCDVVGARYKGFDVLGAVLGVRADKHVVLFAAREMHVPVGHGNKRDLFVKHGAQMDL